MTGIISTVLAALGCVYLAGLIVGAVKAMKDRKRCDAASDEAGRYYCRVSLAVEFGNGCRFISRSRIQSHDRVGFCRGISPAILSAAVAAAETLGPQIEQRSAIVDPFDRLHDKYSKALQGAPGEPVFINYPPLGIEVPGEPDDEGGTLETDLDDLIDEVEKGRNEE